MTALHIGTSDWHYRHWLGLYYPPDIRSEDMLSRYSEVFCTDTVNNSVHSLPAAQPLAQWRRTENRLPVSCLASGLSQSRVCKPVSTYSLTWIGLSFSLIRKA